MRPGTDAALRGRRLFALCLGIYVVLSAGAIGVGVRQAALEASADVRGIVTAVGWISGSFAGLFNVALMLGAVVVSIAAMGFLSRSTVRFVLVFQAYLIILFAGLTPLSVVALDWFVLDRTGSVDSFAVLTGRVQVVSLASMTMAVVYLWWFLGDRFDRRRSDAALSTLVGVTASYASITLIHPLSAALGLE